MTLSESPEVWGYDIPEMRMVRKDDDLLFEYCFADSQLVLLTYEDLSVNPRKDPVANTLLDSDLNPLFLALYEIRPERAIRVHRAELGRKIAYALTREVDGEAKLYPRLGYAVYSSHIAATNLCLEFRAAEGRCFWELAFTSFQSVILGQAEWNDIEGIKALAERFVDLESCERAFALLSPDDARTKYEYHMKTLEEDQEYHLLTSYGVNFDYQKIEELVNSFKENASDFGYENQNRSVRIQRSSLDNDTLLAGVYIRFQCSPAPIINGSIRYDQTTELKRQEAIDSWLKLAQDVTKLGYLIKPGVSKNEANILERSMLILSDNRVYPLLEEDLEVLNSTMFWTGYSWKDPVTWHFR